MKKSLLLFSFLFLAFTGFAQTEAETLEWLNIKKGELGMSMCYSNVVPNGVQTRYLLMTSKNIKLSDINNNWTDGDWANIKEIKTEGNGVKVVFDFAYQGKPSFILVNIEDAELRGKVLKAFKHMATLKGAKMIDNDLF